MYRCGTVMMGQCVQTSKLVFSNLLSQSVGKGIRCTRRPRINSLQVQSLAGVSWTSFSERNNVHVLYKHKAKKNLIYPQCCRSMAGHSKWQNIRHIKAAKDAEKSRMAMKIVQKIRMAAKEGGSTDPNYNSQLAQVLEEGKRNNVPNSTIQQALKRLNEKKDVGSIVMVEARGPGKCFLMIETFTDKVTRTRTELQGLLKKFAASTGEHGTASHSFEHKGVVLSPCRNEEDGSEWSLEDATESAIQAGAEDVESTTDNDGNQVFRFTCDAKDVHSVKKSLESEGRTVTYANQDYIAVSYADLTDNQMELAAGLLDKLEDHPDVTRVFHNVDPNS